MIGGVASEEDWWLCRSRRHHIEGRKFKIKMERFVYYVDYDSAIHAQREAMVSFSKQVMIRFKILFR